MFIEYFLSSKTIMTIFAKVRLIYYEIYLFFCEFKSLLQHFMYITTIIILINP